MAMMIEMYISRKAVYMGNPTINKKTSTLNISHSVASIKLNGFDQPDTPFDIQSFTNTGFGATLRHDFTKDIRQKVTVGRFNPEGTKMLISNGEVIGGGGMTGCGCAQNVDIKLPNGYEFWRASQEFGHHLAMVYGDYTQDIRNLGDLMKFEVVLC
jgi:L-fucose isomerase-like protein